MTWIVVYFLGVSAIGYGLMSDDKVRAQTYRRRISEASLLLVASFGGAFGLKMAQPKFRHKTRKEPFKMSLNYSVVWNVLLFCLLFYALFFHMQGVEELMGKVFDDSPSGRPGSGVIVHRGLN